jgi:hypothetical protein
MCGAFARVLPIGGPAASDVTQFISGCVTRINMSWIVCTHLVMIQLRHWHCWTSCSPSVAGAALQAAALSTQPTSADASQTSLGRADRALTLVATARMRANAAGVASRCWTSNQAYSSETQHAPKKVQQVPMLSCVAVQPDLTNPTS